MGFNNNNNKRCDLRFDSITKIQYDPITQQFFPLINEDEDDINNNTESNNSTITTTSNRILKFYQIMIQKSSSSIKSNNFVYYGDYYYNTEDSVNAIMVMNQDRYNNFDQNYYINYRELIIERRIDDGTSKILYKDDDDDDDTTNNNNNTTSVILYVKRCKCISDKQYPDYEYYCPIDKDYCYIPKSSNYRPPICMNSNYSISLAQTLWPYTLVAFFLLLLCLVATHNGHAVIRYICSILLCCFPVNGWYVQYLLYTNPEKAKYYIRQYCIRRRNEIEEQYISIITNNNIDNNNNNSNQEDNSIRDFVLELDDIEQAMITSNDNYRPSLLLKTCIFDSSAYNNTDTNNGTTTTIVEDGKSNNTDDVNNNDDNDDNIVDYTTFEEEKKDNTDDENDNDYNENFNNNTITQQQQQEQHTCTICFATMEDGVRVGALSCQHIFHVKCLKNWLKRRNVCPLCLQTNVATPGPSISDLTTTILTTRTNNT